MNLSTFVMANLGALVNTEGASQTESFTKKGPGRKHNDAARKRRVAAFFDKAKAEVANRRVSESGRTLWEKESVFGDYVKHYADTVVKKRGNRVYTVTPSREYLQESKVVA